MCGVHLSETDPDVWHHPAENFPTEDHPRTAHTEVLSGLQGQFTQFLCGTQTRLTQIERFTAVQRAEEWLQFLTYTERKTELREKHICTNSNKPLNALVHICIHAGHL